MNVFVSLNSIAGSRYQAGSVVVSQYRVWGRRGSAVLNNIDMPVIGLRPPSFRGHTVQPAGNREPRCGRAQVVTF
jgi:hypothetical protein